MGVTTPRGRHPRGSGDSELPVYAVRRSLRAKRVRLRVDLDGSVTVVVPRRARVTGYDEFVRQHADWVRKQQARFAALRQQGTALCPTNTASVPYRGKPVPVSTEESADGQMSLRYDGERFVLRKPAGAAEEQVRALFREWFRRVARPLFEERVCTLNEPTGYQWLRIRIGEQRTKWGSCSTRGTLSFNWRLLMAPPEVLDYVVVHELAHLKEQNHSPAFWALVEEHCPDHKVHRRWLNKNGMLLAL